jgi:hypothetical protein
VQVHSPCASIVDEVLVGKHLEKRDCLLLVRVNALRWRLIGPAHDAALGVITAEGRKILRVSRIIQALHFLQVLASIHNATFKFSKLLLNESSCKEHKLGGQFAPMPTKYTPGISA